MTKTRALHLELFDILLQKLPTIQGASKIMLVRGAVANLGYHFTGKYWNRSVTIDIHIDWLILSRNPQETFSNIIESLNVRLYEESLPMIAV